jgi:hypothetical protein
MGPIGQILANDSFSRRINRELDTVLHGPERPNAPLHKSRGHFFWRSSRVLSLDLAALAQSSHSSGWQIQLSPAPQNVQSKPSGRWTEERMMMMMMMRQRENKSACQVALMRPAWLGMGGGCAPGPSAWYMVIVSTCLFFYLLIFYSRRSYLPCSVLGRRRKAFRDVGHRFSNMQACCVPADVLVMAVSRG